MPIVPEDVREAALYGTVLHKMLVDNFTHLLINRLNLYL